MSQDEKPVASEGAENSGERPKAAPQVLTIGAGDIVDALGQGLRDFRAAPRFGLFFGGVYALGGMLIVLTASALGMSYISYPLAVGFALIGPFVAVGLYEVSRRREAGEALDWPGVLGVVFAQRKRELGWMAFVSLFVLVVWMYQVRILIALFIGLRAPTTMDAFVSVVLGTPEGLMFLAIGHVIGAAMALVLFSLTVVSFPLLLERELDFVTAMITSVRAVVTNPVPMIGWAFVIMILLMIAIGPFFIGLFVALPILGHTTWHLYRKLVAPEA
ncbi:DUF2189 domain-containing protein [Pelagibius litoralis]|uniref:DUF2189 domain-containing protein n=1 Tax=Pelagibius litoralis TaxID=374515 RepID=A0A967F0B3_9PROT|nr:DUF2189 domain-containing protein [Pelagibius litoralis]NIA70673.1 DUF2189 domain-containing protein [Pelagibius litoralis]